MRIVKLLMLSVVAVVSLGAEADVVPVGEFRSIGLDSGGRVVVRHGATQRVTLVKGDLQYTRIRVGDRQQLLIETARGACPRGYELEVEVVTPRLASVSVSNGGSVRTLGAFPAQASLNAAIQQGGTIDIRSIAADGVHASVYSGGGIFVTARKSLAASVDSGGAITYWGGPEDVKQSVRDGGAVQRGKPGDAEKPVAGLGLPLAPVPPVPPLPPRP